MQGARSNIFYSLNARLITLTQHNIKKINIESPMKKISIGKDKIYRNLKKEPESIFKNNFINSSVKTEKRSNIESSLDFNVQSGRINHIGERSLVFNNIRPAHRLSNSIKNLSDFFEDLNDR